MSLKKKITQIAVEAAKDAVRILAPTLITQVVQTNSSFVGEVVRYKEGNKFIVKDPNGNEKEITYLGDRPIGVGSGMVITDNYGR